MGSIQGQSQEWLKENGMKVGDEARKGNPKALDIIRAYNMWFKYPGDMMAKCLVEVRIQEYLDSIQSDSSKRE